MKKVFFVIVLSFVVCICFALDDDVEGYDNMPWGTTVEEFKEKFPMAKEVTDKDDNLSKQNVYERKDDLVIRYYRFFNNALYWGRTVYTDIDKSMAKAIVTKVRQKYTFLANSGRQVQRAVDSTTYYISTIHQGVQGLGYPAFNSKIEYELRDYYSTSNNYLGNALFITYYDGMKIGVVEHERIKNSNLQL